MLDWTAVQPFWLSPLSISSSRPDFVAAGCKYNFRGAHSPRGPGDWAGPRAGGRHQDLCPRGALNRSVSSPGLASLLTWVQIFALLACSAQPDTAQLWVHWHQQGFEPGVDSASKCLVCTSFLLAHDVKALRS